MYSKSCKKLTWSNKSIFVGFFVLAVLANSVWTFPAEDDSSKSKATSSTAKPVRHPNYVRLLKRNKPGDDNEPAEDVVSDAVAGSSATKAKEDKPADVLASVASLPREKLTPEKIKEIIPYLEFNDSGINKNRGPTTDSPRTSITEVQRPRGIAGLFSLLARPLNALRNFGNRNKSNNNNNFSFGNSNNNNGDLNASPSLTISNRNTNKDDESDSGSKAKNGTSFSFGSSSSFTTPKPGSANNNSSGGLFRSPGNLILGMVKAIQGMTHTFGDMVASFVKLFNFNNRNGSNDGSRGNRLFSNNN